MWRLTVQSSSFENQHRLHLAAEHVRTLLSELHKLGYGKPDGNSDDPANLQSAKALATELIHYGDELLLYHKRLAIGSGAYGFLHQHDIAEHFARYHDVRIARELDQLARDTDDLLRAYDRLVEEDPRLLLDRLSLPDDLAADFRLTRNLFSVGFDDVGILIAGRGLEGVLRAIARARKIMILVKGKAEPVYDADAYDIIEALSHVRWKASGVRLLDRETKALLHYLPTKRNGGAHPQTAAGIPAASPRETAVIITDVANNLWRSVTTTRAWLDPLLVPKTW